MKRFSLIIVLFSLSLSTFAQGQEDHVVRRGRYKAAVTQEVEKVRLHWSNNFSAGVLLGSYSVSESNTDYTFRKPSSAVSITLNSGVFNNDKTKLDRNSISAVFLLSYERLYNKNNFYIGPGAALMVGKGFAPGLFLRSKYDIIDTHVRPFITGAIGLAYYITNGDNRNYYHIKYDKTGSSSYSSNLKLRGEFETIEDLPIKSGIRPYFDIGCGVAFDLSDNSVLTLSYRGVLRPYVKQSFNISDHKSDLDALLIAHSGGTDYYSASRDYNVKVEYPYTLYHGIVVTIAF